MKPLLSVVNRSEAKRSVAKLPVVVLAMATLGAVMPALAADVVAVSVPDARTQVQQLLMRMNDAVRMQDYVGHLVYVQNNRPVTLRIMHRNNNGMESGRVMVLEGLPMQLVHQQGGDAPLCILNGDAVREAMRNAMPGTALARLISQQMQAVGRFYQIAMAGEDRIAGRNAMRVSIRSSDGSRFGYQFWIDRDSHLLLKSVLTDPAGQPLETVSFTDLSVGPAAVARMPQAQQRSQPCPQAKHEQKVMATSTPAQWQVVVPDGFSAQESGMARRVAMAGRMVDAMHFSDGLTGFTLFYEKVLNNAKVRDMTHRMGATVAVSRIRAAPDGQRYLVTLMGELPAQTAEQVADSARWVADR